MKDDKNKLLNKLIFPPNTQVESNKILCAVSGGADSISLVYLLLEYGFTVDIAHCNYQLRGDEAEKDADFVQQLAQKLGLACWIKNFAVKDFAKENNYSVQEAARLLRYDWFQTLRKQYAYAYIATAHHQDDQVETLLYNIARHKGFKVLQGIPFENAKVIRPLLNIPKAELIAYLHTKAQEYRHDSSNESLIYARNRVRNQIIPEYNILNPSLNKFITEKYTLYQLQYNFLTEKISEQLTPFLSTKFNAAWVLDTIQNHEHYSLLIHYLLSELWFVPSAQQPEVLKLWTTQTGRYIDTPGGRIFRERNALSFLPKAYLDIPNPQTILKNRNRNYCFGNKIVSISFIHKRKIKEFSSKKHTYLLDVQNIKGDIVIRSIEKGEKMKPCGSHFNKKVVDLLTDAHCPVVEKHTAFVVADENDVLFVAGLRPARIAQLKPSSQNIMVLTIRYQV